MKNFEDFVIKYKPIKNELTEDAPFDGLMFETCGVEYAQVNAALTADPRCIWSLLDCDGAEVLCSGWRFVNRQGYFICTVPFEGEYCEVVLSEYTEDEAALDQDND